MLRWRESGDLKFQRRESGDLKFHHLQAIRGCVPSSLQRKSGKTKDLNKSQSHKIIPKMSTFQ